jgi:5-bromo-4-chloroindolyl phosphate hydrolysis protein
MWRVFGLRKLAMQATLVGLIITIIALIAALIVVVHAMRQMQRLSRQIIQLQIDYYKVQNISTCRQMTGAGPPLKDLQWFREITTPLQLQEPDSAILNGEQAPDTENQ